MGFAQWMLKIGADPEGVRKGTRTAANHFKELGDKLDNIQRRNIQAQKQQISNEEKINNLKRTQAQIQSRLDAGVDNLRIRNAYLAKQAELERQIFSVRQQEASKGAIDVRGVLNQIPGFSRLSGIFGAFKGFGGVAAAGVGAAAAAGLVNERSKAANSLVDLQSTTGFSTNALQKLQFAGTATGGNQDALIDSAITLRKNQSLALAGNEKQLRNFERLGYSIERLRQIAPEDLFFDLADKINKGEVNTYNFAAAMTVLGDNAKTVIPAFKNDLAGLAKEFERSGGVMDESLVESLNNFRASMQKAQAEAKGFFAFLGNGFAAGFLGLGRRLTDLTGFTGFGGGLDTYGELSAKTELIGDEEYGASLRETQRLQSRLNQRQSARDSFEGTDDFLVSMLNNLGIPTEDAKKAKKKKHVSLGDGGEFEFKDVDKLTQIGLYTGASSTVQKWREDTLSKLTAIEKRLDSIDQKADE